MGKASIIQPQTENYQTLAHEYYEYLLQLGYNPKSCRSKWRRLIEFLQYAETAITTDITAITTKDILQFYEYIQNRPSKRDGNILNKKTIWDFMQAVIGFYTMLQYKNKILINPTNTIKIEYQKTESPRTALTQAEIQEIYQQAKTYKEKAILALGYGCGLRVSEIVQCNIEDVRIREQILIVPKGKNNKSRTVPMSKTVAKDVANYFYKERLQQESKDPKAFILHSKLKRMQKGTYNSILKKLIDRTQNEIIKTKQISIHNLRHSIATHLIEQGVPLERVREFLGHSQLESTEVYTHISQLQLQKLVE